MRITLFVVICMLPIISKAAINFASYNIRNFDYDQRSETPTNKLELVKTINSLSPDLLAVQEINQVAVFKNMISENFNNKYQSELTECGGAHGQRLGFVYNTSKLKLISFHQDLRTSDVNNRQALCNDGSRPLAVAKFKDLKKNKVFIAISVHLKSGSRPQSIKKRFKQLQEISNLVRSYKSSGINSFIIMGDFNSTEYIHQGQHHNKFKMMVKEMGLIDMSKELPCSSYWWGGIQDDTQYPSLLDHILISPDMLGKQENKIETRGHCALNQCQPTLEFDMGINFNEVSDHCPILLEVKG